MKTKMQKELLSESASCALTEKAPLIEAAFSAILSAVDDSSHTCECCGLVLRHCFRDHQLAENLRSMREKVRKWRLEATASGSGSTSSASPRP